MSETRPTAASVLAGHEVLELTIEKLVAGGDGFGRFEGAPIFVPRAAPGDRLRIRLTDRRADYGRGEIVEILSPGPGRREAPCPYFERCGGCDLQHLEDALQSRLKAEAALETLRRLGGVKLDREPRLITGDAWGYRLRTQLHVEPATVEPPTIEEVQAEPLEDAAREPVEPEAAGAHRPRVGYRARHSHELIEVEVCPILVPEIERWLPTLPDALQGENPHRRIDLTAGGNGALTTAPRVDGLPTGDVSLTVELPAGSDSKASSRAESYTYSYDARTFFQAHRGLVGELLRAAMGPDMSPDMGGGSAEAGAPPAGQAFDLYGGVGLFSLPLARRYTQVTLVEGDRVAARFARNNARRNRLSNVEVVAQAVETWVRQLPEGAARVLVDPPRAGLGKVVRCALLEKRPRWITYVSCHAATLARDLRLLGEHYRVESAIFLDLFPQTGHLETVVQLRLS